MKPEPLFDLSAIDLGRTIITAEEIQKHNPHRHEMALLDGLVHFDPETLDAVGFHDLASDAFWVRGHIPGFPLFPGALMVECAAQLSSYCYRQRYDARDRFFGFGGIDKVKFRSMASPGQRFYVLCSQIVLNRRFSRFKVQGMVESELVFEGEITGVSIPVASGKPSEASA